MKAEDLVLLYEAEDEISAAILSDMLASRNIPALVRSLEDKAFDGLWELQEGGIWGRIFVPKAQETVARQVLQDYLDSIEQVQEAEETEELSPEADE